MAEAYTTRDGDMVDAIVWKHEDYRNADPDKAVKAVYDANPGLVDRGPLLPGGLRIVLPDLPKPETLPIVRLWGAPR